ncbi:MAG: helix-turn-helix transcriptional regulator [Ruminococcaceae bacterium]|nr:helix-turn-helix transcriptional regulator [Oscillospiraceae bacterium]
MFDTTKFGALVAKLRKSADMTQSDLADKLGLTRQAISRYECGDSFPDIAVLREMASIFGISVDLLISAGNPTEGEAEILRSVAEGREVRDASSADVASLAPWLRPSILQKLSESMAKTDIDISHMVALAEYLNDTDTEKLMKAVSFDSLAEMNQGLLSKLLPLLGPYAIDTIFQKIIDGELDYRYLEMLGGYQYYSLVEAACIYGALDMDALNIMRRHSYNRLRLEKRGVIKLFTCPVCGELLSHFYPRICGCGHRVNGDGGVLRFTDEGAPLALAAAPFAPHLPEGDRLLILMLGAEIDMEELLGYYKNAHEQCEMIVIDRGLDRLLTLASALRTKSFHQIALVLDDPAAPHLADGMFDVIIDNTADGLSDSPAVRAKLKQGGCIILGGSVKRAE